MEAERQRVTQREEEDDELVCIDENNINERIHSSDCVKISAGVQQEPAGSTVRRDHNRAERGGDVMRSDQKLTQGSSVKRVQTLLQIQNLGLCVEYQSVLVLFDWQIKETD